MKTTKLKELETSANLLKGSMQALQERLMAQFKVDINDLERWSVVNSNPAQIRYIPAGHPNSAMEAAVASRLEYMVQVKEQPDGSMTIQIVASGVEITAEIPIQPGEVADCVNCIFAEWQLERAKEVCAKVSGIIEEVIGDAGKSWEVVDAEIE